MHSIVASRRNDLALTLNAPWHAYQWRAFPWSGAVKCRSGRQRVGPCVCSCTTRSSGRCALLHLLSDQHSVR